MPKILVQKFNIILNSLYRYHNYTLFFSKIQQHGVPTIQHYSDSIAISSGMRQILPGSVPFSPNFYEYQPVQTMHNMHSPVSKVSCIV